MRFKKAEAQKHCDPNLHRITFLRRIVDRFFKPGATNAIPIRFSILEIKENRLQKITKMNECDLS